MNDLTPIFRSSRSVSSFADPQNKQHKKAKETARKLEAIMIAELLKSAGLGDENTHFTQMMSGETPGKLQYRSVAEKIVLAGGIGLSQHFFRMILEHDQPSQPG
ncbi:MAG: hypothetical protein AAF066_00495 [Pseudomonadota bacterium]